VQVCASIQTSELNGVGQPDEGKVVGEEERVPVLVSEEVGGGNGDLAGFVLADVVGAQDHFDEAGAERQREWRAINT